MKYLIKVSPVTNQIPIVREAYMQLLGTENRRKVHDLVSNGGVLIDNLNKDEASRIASDLRILFVVNYEVLEMESNDPEADLKNDNLTYEVRLVDAGPSKLAVVKLINEITDFGLKDSKEIVDNLGVVGLYKSREEAEKIKTSLTSAGAKVNIQIAEEPAMEPDLNDLQRSTFRVKLDSVGGNKMAVIRAVQKILLRVEAESIVEELGTVVDMVSRATAYKIQKELASAGANSEIIPSSTPQRRPTPDASSERNDLIVFGQILHTNKQPVEGCTVRAFDRELRSEQLLGETRTDSKGSYKITYTKEQFKRAEKGAADLVVRAFNPVGTLLVMSDILFDASPEERFDLIVEKSAPVQPSVYERLVAVLTPLLDGVTFADLTSDDIWFLADKTGRTIEEIVFLAEDARLSQSTEIPEAVFFGLVINNIGVLEPVIGQKLPVIELATVLDESVEHLLEVITQAIERNSVPRVLRNQLWKIRSQFESLKLSHNLESTPKRIERFKKLGRIAGLDDNVSKRISYRIVGNTPTNEELKGLVDEGVIRSSELFNVRLTFHLAELTNLDIKLVETLRFHVIPRIGGHVSSLRDLAALDESDWLSVLEDYGIVPPEDQEKKDYARQIAWNVELRFPTSVFLHRIVGRDWLKLPEQLQSIEALLHSNTQLFTRVSRLQPDAEDVEIPENLIDTVFELFKIARTFTHLEVPEVMDDPELSPTEKTEELTKRITLINTFFERNGEFNLRDADLFNTGENDNGVGVSYEGLEPEEMSRVRRQLIAYQQVILSAPTVADATRMIESGFEKW